MTLSYFIGRACFRAVFATYFRWRIHHPERVPAEGPVILAANHASYIDPPFIGSALPRELCYLARDSLFRYPVVGWVLRSWNAIPVDRAGASPAGLRAVCERLDSGHGVILFPEGTRTSDGKLGAARAGLGLIVVRSEAPVVPVRVSGTYESLSRHAWFPRPGPISVVYGHPLDFRRAREERKTASKTRAKEIYAEVAGEIMRAIDQLQPFTQVSSFPATRRR